MRVVLVLLLAFIPLTREHSYSTRLLAELGGKVIPELQGDVYKGCAVAMREDDGVVDHIGIRLFDDELKQDQYGYIYEFPERYLLEILAEKDSEALEVKMTHDSVKLVTGNLDSISDIQKKGEAFSVTVTSDFKYRYSWSDASGSEIFAMTAPAQCELMLGRNKIELEERFRLMASRSVFPEGFYPLSPVAEPLRLNRDVYVDKRGEYMTELMRGDVYYKKDGKEYKLLSDSRHPYETLCNMLIVPDAFADRDYVAEVTLNGYGFEKRNFRCPLRRLMNICLWEGCVPYVGLEEESGDKIVVTLVMVNESLGYNHTLKVEVSPEILSGRKGVVKITANVYTAVHNLKSLYDDYGHGPKNHVKRIKVNI